MERSDQKQQIRGMLEEENRQIRSRMKDEHTRTKLHRPIIKSYQRFEATCCRLAAARERADETQQQLVGALKDQHNVDVNALQRYRDNLDMEEENGGDVADQRQQAIFERNRISNISIRR